MQHKTPIRRTKGTTRTTDEIPANLTSKVFDPATPRRDHLSNAPSGRQRTCFRGTDGRQREASHHTKISVKSEQTAPVNRTKRDAACPRERDTPGADPLATMSGGHP